MASRIRDLREKAGMTQDDLAKKCKVSRSAVALWETDRTRALKTDHLFAAASALGVDPQFLATGKKGMATSLQEIPARARAVLESYMELPDHLQVQFGALVQSMASQVQRDLEADDEAHAERQRHKPPRN